MPDDEHLQMRELVAALKHDLAKYVAWRSANYGDDVWEGPLTGELVAALQADVLQTKGTQSAWDVWDAAAAELTPDDHPELREVGRAVDVLRGHEAALREGASALAAARGEIREAQQSIRAQLRDLHRRLGRE